MTPTLTCPICGRTFRTALFAELHRETFHAPPPSPSVQQFARIMLDEHNAHMNALTANTLRHVLPVRPTHPAPPTLREGTGTGEMG